MFFERTPVLRVITGTLALALGALFLPMGVAIPFAAIFVGGSGATWLPLVLAVSLIGLGTFLWVSAIRSVPGDDILAGERATLLSVLIVLAVLIALGTGWMLFHESAWHGFIDAVTN